MRAVPGSTAIVKPMSTGCLFVFAIPLLAVWYFMLGQANAVIREWRAEPVQAQVTGYLQRRGVYSPMVATAATPQQPAQSQTLPQPGWRYSIGTEIALLRDADAPHALFERKAHAWAWLLFSIVASLPLLWIARSRDAQAIRRNARWLLPALTSGLWLLAALQVHERLLFLARGVQTEALVLGRDRFTEQSSPTRGIVVVGFVARDPVRLVTVATRNPIAVLMTNRAGVPATGRRVQVLYRPDNVNRVLLLPPQRWLLWAEPAGWLVLGGLALLLVPGQHRSGRLTAAETAA